MDKLTLQAIAASIGLAFSVGATAQAMTKADYKSARSGIAADYKSANTACASRSGNAKDVCKAEAKGTEKVASAELEARYAPSDKNRRAVSVAKARADYAVAREKCDDHKGDARKACVKDAKAAENRAMAGTSAAIAAPAPASKTARAGVYIDDSVITTKVKAAIFEEPTLKSAEINVETSKGRVQLSGFVRSRTDINKAVQVARKVEGVASVQNVMIVKGQQ